ncbi:MAG: hypothetical protein IKT57_04610 [Clostridia bacterium]|nr:hypothetical protein [Clostridia bacterium]
MDHYEMVEKLRQKANVTYEEAKTALETANWDILDALVLLESEGKVHQNSSTFTTEEKPVEKPKSNNKRDFVDMLNRVFGYIKQFIAFLSRNEMHIKWRDGQNLEMNLLVLAIFLLLCFPLTVILFIIAFFKGARFSLHGPNVDNLNMQVSLNKDEQENKNNTQN